MNRWENIGVVIGGLNRGAKIGVVIGGYFAAIVAAVAAGWLYDVRVSKLPYDTSGGMYAGGEMLQSLAAFFMVALVPTVLGLWFVRRHRKFWNGVAITSVVFAAIGLLGVLTFLLAHNTSNVAVMLMDLVGLAQLLGVPLWGAGFVVLAYLAPTQEARRKLILAVAIEAVIGIVAIVHWLPAYTPL